MTKQLKSLCLVLLFCSMQFISAAPASQNLIKKLDTKITYRSEGESIHVQLKKLAEQVDLYFDFDSSAKTNLETKTKKFTYSQIRAKYVFYRLLKDAGLKYKFDGDSIEVYKD